MYKNDDPGMTMMPRRPKAGGIDAALRVVLEHSLRERLGKSAHIIDLQRRPCSFHSSYPLEELTIDLADGTRVDAIWKDLSPGRLLKEARRIKPRFLYDPRREIAVYQHILGPLQLRAATYYGALVDDARRRYWLFLENVPGQHLWQFGEFEMWLCAARWLAEMHGRCSTFAGDDVRLRAAPLLRYDPAFYLGWADRARRYVALSSAFTAKQAESVRRVTRGYKTVAARLASFSSTFIHGEFYPSNILISHVGREVQVRPVDWEMAAIGPACIDLAALTAGRWTDAQKVELVAAYYQTRQMGTNASWVDRQSFEEQLDYCRLHLAIQWLGWSRQWSPPRQHVQDWVAEAVGAAERIGL